MGSQLNEEDHWHKKEQEYLDKQPLLPWGILAGIALVGCGILIVILKLGA